MIKYILFTLLFILSLAPIKAQELIREANISLQLPNKDWSLGQKHDLGKTQVYFFEYKKNQSKSYGSSTGAKISVMIQELDKAMTTKDYAKEKLTEASTFTVLKQYKEHDKIMQLKNAQAYFGEYENYTGNKHFAYVIYATHKGKGIMISYDCPARDFKTIDPHFKSVLKSLKRLP